MSHHAAGFVDRISIQHRLFAKLSAMFAKEVPLYGGALAVNLASNRTVCDLLSARHPGFAITDEQIDRTSGERHGAIRIGRPDEYRWIGRFFSVFGMQPHNYYDMSSVGAKSQPVIATAFRSTMNPEHRVFSSLLRTDYFDVQTKARIEELLSTRDVFGDHARELIAKDERQGGLSESDADALINEATTRIFKWTGRARDHGLYTELCDNGFKIAADIVCFESHHLNHLTPNTFWIDLYTTSMRRAMGLYDDAQFRHQATQALERLNADADMHYMRLHFRHLTSGEIDGFGDVDAAAVTPEIGGFVDALANRLSHAECQLHGLPHSGFKDHTEGPAVGVSVLLRQDAYKALTEPVTFVNPDGSSLDTVHTARFGEIEQRFYATTPIGRAMYDECLNVLEAKKAEDPDLATRDVDGYRALQAGIFAPFPNTLDELLDRGLVFGRFAPTDAGIAAAGTIDVASVTGSEGRLDVHALRRQGLVRAEGLRYEDFLPVSAAGIFASNLDQYGTKGVADRAEFPQERLEEVLGRPIVDTTAMYRAIEAKSLLETFSALGLTEGMDAAQRVELERNASIVDDVTILTGVGG
jgi:uncharacterized glyoxalase superfamily metalloenzyme YdcJ